MSEQVKPIYLDYASTTPVDDRVANKMMEFMDDASQRDSSKPDFFLE